MPLARTTDPLTSHEAAESVKNLSEVKRTIYSLLEYARTDEQLTMAYYKLVKAGLASRATDSGIRSRRADLVSAGLVKPVGFDKTITGRRAIVWGRS